MHDLNNIKIGNFIYFVLDLIFSAHLNHIKLVAGVDYVGLGAGYDGINL